MTMLAADKQPTCTALLFKCRTASSLPSDHTASQAAEALWRDWDFVKGIFAGERGWRLRNIRWKGSKNNDQHPPSYIPGERQSLTGKEKCCRKHVTHSHIHVPEHLVHLLLIVNTTGLRGRLEWETRLPATNAHTGTRRKTSLTISTACVDTSMFTSVRLFSLMSSRVVSWLLRARESDFALTHSPWGHIEILVVNSTRFASNL